MVTKIFENGMEIAKVSDKLSTSEISKLFPGRTIALERNVGAAEKPNKIRKGFFKKLKPLRNSEPKPESKKKKVVKKKASLKKRVVKTPLGTLKTGKKVVKSKAFKGLIGAANRRSNELSKTGSSKMKLYTPIKKKKLY